MKTITLEEQSMKSHGKGFENTSANGKVNIFDTTTKLYLINPNTI